MHVPILAYVYAVVRVHDDTHSDDFARLGVLSGNLIRVWRLSRLHAGTPRRFRTPGEGLSGFRIQALLSWGLWAETESVWSGAQLEEPA